MAFSKSRAVAGIKFHAGMLLAAVVLAAVMSPAAAQGGCGRKVTVQNLSGRDLALGIEPLANSPMLYQPGWVLRHGTHSEFGVCNWTGRVSAPGAALVEFHLGYDGGAWYQVSTAQSAGAVLVSVTPHGALQGHCPTAGCAAGGKCFEHAVPGGNCHGVTEIKIIFYPK